jgi:hypothetical protein
MAKYQLRNKHKEEWEEGNPILELAALLEVLPYTVVTLSDNIEWRLKPRDTELEGAIREALKYYYPVETLSAAAAIYDLLEERGLV